MRFVASAPGKLVLLGEYAVLAGAPALVIAVDRRARVRIETAASRSRIDALALGIEDCGFALRAGRFVLEAARDEAVQRKLAVLAAAIEGAAAFAVARGGHVGPVHLTTETEAFFGPSGEKLGLGSSAAVLVAAFAGLLRTAGLGATTIELVRPAIEAHRAAQGHGSGVDVAASCLGGALRFLLTDPDGARVPSAEKVLLPPELRILAVWSGAPIATGDRLAELAAFRRRRPNDYARQMVELSMVCAAGLAAFGRGDLQAFFAALGSFRGGLTELARASGIDLVLESHARIAEIVARAGGVYKPSGAGGDFGLALASEAAVAARIEAALAEHHLLTFPVTPASAGVTVEALE